ncbi:MAG: hypothetical protein A2W99_11835 [Bacteroidetes bacterium GWF2_33_16]|nr:MAG: hypothetical protein A2X00_02440 [Bacteroidetes bacterium GWE2_32_14]OFY06389.1 MAG: hypothetical protein A2W99_11835 [Bacteroidetes bacterium GWF2_33_16]
MKLKHIVSLIIIFSSLNTYSQYSNSIVLPIMDINSNARLGGIGDIGVVSSDFYKDAGLFQNPSLISNNSIFSGTGLNLRSIKDSYIEYACIEGWNGYFAIDSLNAIGFNLSYLNYEDQLITDELGKPLPDFEPYELFLQFNYSRSFTKTLSAGMGIKYIRSNYAFSELETTINSFSVDLGINYHKKYNLANNSNLTTSSGMAITNFGPRISNNRDEKAFIPSKILFGLFINPDIEISHLFRLNIELGYQAEKYLIPSEPVYNTEGEIIEGKDPDITAFNALYQSFYDSPDGFSGELDEIRNKFGSEFRLNFMNTAFIALRHGRIFELESLDGGNYQTFGGGLGLWGFMIDYMYINSDNDFLNNNWAITLSARYNLDGDFFRF